MCPMSKEFPGEDEDLVLEDVDDEEDELLFDDADFDRYRYFSRRFTHFFDLLQHFRYRRHIWRHFLHRGEVLQCLYVARNAA